MRRYGRPTATVTQTLLHRADELNNYPQITTYKLTTELPLSYKSVNNIIDALWYSKVWDRWVPQSPTDYHNVVQKEVCSDLPSHNVADGESFSSRIVATDETWIHQFIIQTNKCTTYILTIFYIS